MSLREMGPVQLLSLLLRVIGCFAIGVGQWGCGSDGTHARFEWMLDEQIGKHRDEPYSDIKRYPEMHVATTVLPNGNIEEHLQMGIGWRCQVYFEVDKLSQQIVGWRSEGKDYECAHSR